MILAAAIKGGSGQIYSLPPPARHHDIFRIMNKTERTNHIQGFIDNKLGFIDRHTAYSIVRQQNQKLIRKTHPLDELFSEDLW